MKQFLAGAIGLLALGMAAPAIAADVSPVPYAGGRTYIPALYDWSGFYIGANGGYGTGRSCWDSTDVSGNIIARDTCHNATGAVAGGQVGYRWQTGTWVFGVDAQGDWANLRGSSVSSLNPALTNRTSIDAFGLFTAQVGYAWNNVLLYVKGGAAITGDSYELRNTAGNTIAATSNLDYSRWGGTAGVGVEYGFATDWSAGVQYDRLFMQNRPTAFTAPGSASPLANDRIRNDVDLVTVRVNYRWGGPVVGRY